MTLLLVGGHVIDFIKALEGAAPADDPRVIFRPSFGRRATQRGPDDAPMGSRRALFGEFDAIVGTTQGTYLVEVKWPNSKRSAADNVLELDRKQVRRHAVMTQYLEAWRAAPAPWADAPAEERWRTFVSQSDIEARLEPLGVSVPRPSALLAGSLAQVLRVLKGCGPAKDILLFCRTLHDVEGGRLRSRQVVPRAVRPDTFTLIVADLRHNQFDGFVHLPALNIDRPHWVEFTRH